MKSVFRNILYFFSGFVKKRNDILIFGSWFGKRIGDNSKYLLDYYLTESSSNDVKIYWVGQKELQSEINKLYGNKVGFLEKDKIATYLVILKAKYQFVSHGYNDLGRVNLSRNAILTQLWHGYPFKKIAFDSGDEEASRKHYYSKYNYFLSSGRDMDSRLLSAFRFYGITNDNIIRSGYPRTDVFNKQNHYTNAVNDFKKSYGINDEDVVISYLPTFRDSNSQDFSFSDIEDQQFQLLRDKNVKIIEKRHLAATKNNHKDRTGIIKITNELDTQLLLMISDILITDFSSVFADYSLLDRPIIHYLYDKDYYTRQDRGIYSESFEEDAMGPIVFEVDSLIESILKNIDEDEYRNYRRNKKKNIMEYNLENNSKYIMEKILNRN